MINTHQEMEYLKLLNGILTGGRKSVNRTATDTIKTHGVQLKFDLNRKMVPILPLLTTKKMNLHAIQQELFWFLKGDTNAISLQKNNVNIWNQWALTEKVSRRKDLTAAERLELYLKDHPDSTADNVKDKVREYISMGLEIPVEDITVMQLDKGIHFFMDMANIPTNVAMEQLPVGALGPIYGHSFRHYPAGDYFYKLTEQQLDDYRQGLMADAKAELQSLLNGNINTSDLRSALTKQGIDQVSLAISQLKNYPNSRRIMIDLWNQEAVPPDGQSVEDNIRNGFAALAFCHLGCQFLTEELTEDEKKTLRYREAVRLGIIEENDGYDENNEILTQLREQSDVCNVHYRLNVVATQRSADLPIGVPYNIASYALFTHMVASIVNMAPGTLTWQGGDVHIYENQINGIKEQLRRKPYPFPTINVKQGVSDITEFFNDDTLIELGNYDHNSAIRMPVAK